MKWHILLGLLLIPLVSANLCENYLAELVGIEGAEVPNGIPYSNEIFHVSTFDEQDIGTLVLKDKKVENFLCGFEGDASYTVSIKNISVIKEIKEADSFVDAINDAIKDKDIIVKGVTIGKKVKLFFSRIGLNIASWFS